MTTEAARTYVGRRVLEEMEDARNYTDAVFARVRSEAGSAGTILDFGAGSGAVARRFLAAGRPVDCLEVDGALRAELDGTEGGIFAEIAEIPSQSYDFIYSINVLEHIEAVDAACAELFRVLRPGGRLFAFVPAFRVLWTSLDDEVGHCRRFTRRTLVELLSGGGLVVRRTEYFDSLGFPAALAIRLMERVGLFRYDRKSIQLYDRVIFPLSRVADRVLCQVVGKNLIALATKPPDARADSSASMPQVRPRPESE